MPAPTISTIASNRPRETGGSNAFRAFDYQVNVSMALILDLHRRGEEFVAVFDHHDDLILFVGAGEEAEVSFYQVKSTSELTWTAKRLAKRSSKGDLPKSIIGKAYYNVTQFGPDICRAAILSNRPLNATMASSERQALHDGELSMADLCVDDQATLIKALDADFPYGFDRSHSTILRFERVPYDLESYRETILGKIVKLLEELHPDFVACASPFYAAVLTAVGECTGNTAKSATVEDLRERVALDRDDIVRLIQRVQSRSKNLYEWWSTVDAELVAAGNRALQIQRIKNKCISYTNARRSGERAASELCDQITDAIGQTSANEADSVMSAITMLMLCDLTEPSSQEYDLQSAMIVELMESIV